MGKETGRFIQPNLLNRTGFMEHLRLKNFWDQFLMFFKQIWEVFKLISPKKYGLFLFLFIPVIFLLNAIVLHSYLGKFFLTSVDPEYFYLYNGILIGGGNLDIKFIATPGIPLDFLIATSSRIINFFQPGDFGKDFIDDPEKYIHAANLFMNILIALVLFTCGYYTKKYSGSYLAGLLFQLGIFGAADLLILSGRVIPEAIMMIPLLFVGLMVIKTIYQEDNSPGTSADIVLFALIIGFGIACKLTFSPVLLIPLVLLRRPYRQKIKLILYTVLFFAIFAYPVVVNFQKFWLWVSGLFLHSGHYGAGSKNFVDLSVIPGNFRTLFNNDKMFFYIAIFSLLAAVVFSFRAFKNKEVINSRIVRAILGINLSLLISLIFTLKHFALYYFMPFYLFKYLLVLLCILLIVSNQNNSVLKRYKAVTLIFFSIFILYISYGEVRQIRAGIVHYRQRNGIVEREYKKIISLVEPGKPIILTCPYYGSPFIEFGHFNGYMESRKLASGFKPYLKEKFPVTFQYVPWSEGFYQWGDFYLFKGILEKTKTSFYVYIGKTKSDDLPVIEGRIWDVLDKDSSVKKVLYADEKTGERLIEIIPGQKKHN
jgi:hypothetical protein